MRSRKYKNTKVEIDGFKFDSKKEAKRYRDLRLLQRAGEIQDLELQPKYDLIPTTKIQGKTHRKVTYKADFKYFDVKTNKWVIEDVKGMKTQIYGIKKRLMKTIHDVEVLET